VPQNGKALPPLVTAAQIVAAFPRIRGKEINEVMVESLVEYINDEAPFHPTPELKGTHRKSIMDPFWTALGAMDRAGQPMVESLKWRRTLFSATLPKYGLSPATSDLDDSIEKLETILRLVRELRTSMFKPTYGKRSARWHDVAAALAPLVAKIYEAAGRKTVNFLEPSAPGVEAVRWSLAQLGYPVKRDAIAQYFRRARKRLTTRSA
jgi:hypothetical protein